MQSLEARMKDRTDGLQKLLAERMEKEIADITAVMTELQHMIALELKEPDTSSWNCSRRTNVNNCAGTLMHYVCVWFKFRRSWRKKSRGFARGMLIRKQDCSLWQ